MKPTPFHSARQLGAVLRSTRERAGHSQAVLARRAGVERQWLVLLETGRIDNPTLGNVMKVVAALDLQLLVAGHGDESTPEPTLDELMGDR